MLQILTNGLKFGFGWGLLIRIPFMRGLLTALFPHRMIRVPIIPFFLQHSIFYSPNSPLLEKEKSPPND